MSSITPQAFKDYEELIRAISTGSKAYDQANSDGKVNWKDTPVMIPFVLAAVKGADGIHNVLHVLQATDPQDIEKRETIFREQFNITQASDVLNVLIENILINILGVFSNIIAITKLTKAV